jgi:hypothetical protein
MLAHKSDLFGERMGLSDISRLRGFVSTGEEYNDLSAADGEIDSVSRAEIDFHLGNTAADGTGLAQVAVLGLLDPAGNRDLGAQVSQPDVPG